MLLSSFFVVDFNKYDNLPEVRLPENSYLSYKINAASIHLIDSFYRKLFLSPKRYPFCLLIDMEYELNKPGAEIHTIIDFLVSFSFHINYLKANHDNPIVIFEINKTDRCEYLSTIRETFKSHGYNDIETIVLHKDGLPLPEKQRKNICFYLEKGMSTLSSQYINSIKQLSSSDSSFFFFLNNPEQLPDVLDTIQKAEQMVSEDLHQIYYLIKENKSLTAKEHELCSKTELLQEQLDSLNNYHLFNNSDNRYKKQVIEIAKFYKNEYEILPLWYKRIGHILKVIMGKRSFRSLFNDKVKKYKD
jgi:hypothetical protein